MKQKLIKLSEDHYIIVDDSEIQIGDYLSNIVLNDKFPRQVTKDMFDEGFVIGDKKITYSTDINVNVLYYIPLSEVQELIYGYSIEKIANNQWGNVHRSGVLGYIEGFKAHQELTKNKLDKALELLQYFVIRVEEGSIKSKTTYTMYKEFLNGINFKTEWDVEFDEQGKLKLIESGRVENLQISS